MKNLKYVLSLITHAGFQLKQARFLKIKTNFPGKF